MSIFATSLTHLDHLSNVPNSLINNNNILTIKKNLKLNVINDNFYLYKSYDINKKNNVILKYLCLNCNLIFDENFNYVFRLLTR